MNSDTPTRDYVLGGADAEHERLIRQAAFLEPFTERFFVAAGIGLGQRVLDLGCGVGDVSLLLARLVGPRGHVTGIDRDVTALEKARSRAAAAGAHWVRFEASDVADASDRTPFDAAVGRFILMFQPDQVSVLRAVAQRVRPGGVLAFQEASWAIWFPQMAHLPLWSACGTLVTDTLTRAGARADNALALYHGFQDAGLPAPTLRFELPIVDDDAARRWVFELLCTLLPRLKELGLSDQAVGDFGTLQERLERELKDRRSFAAYIPLVGAWARRSAA